MDPGQEGDRPGVASLSSLGGAPRALRSASSSRRASAFKLGGKSGWSFGGDASVMGQHIPAWCVPLVQETPAAQAMLFVKHAHELQSRIREPAFIVFSNGAQQHGFSQSVCRRSVGHEDG